MSALAHFISQPVQDNDKASHHNYASYLNQCNTFYPGTLHPQPPPQQTAQWIQPTRLGVQGQTPARTAPLQLQCLGRPLSSVSNSAQVDTWPWSSLGPLCENRALQCAYSQQGAQVCLPCRTSPHGISRGGRDHHPCPGTQPIVGVSPQGPGPHQHAKSTIHALD